MISVIVPMYNEERNIANLLAQLSHLDGDYEIVLMDGGSTDRTWELARAALPRNARLLKSPRGRAAQSNAAAREAIGDTFFFLHADSQIATDTLRHIEKATSNGVQWGCLKLRFDERHPLMILCACFSNLRVKLTGVAFGDQGIFVKSDLFLQEGGFPELPLMEDYAFSLRLRKRGIFPVQLRCPIITSARRFKTHGRLRVMLLMWWLRCLYRNGGDIKRIAARYRHVR